jgi:hypothetical protein
MKFNITNTKDFNRRSLSGILIAQVFIHVFASCTFPKGDCLNGNANLLNTIYFVNFSQQEVDTVFLISYRTTSNFTQMLDSSVIFGFKYDSLRSFAQTPLINIDFDYKISMKKTGLIFKLTGFTTKKAVCTSGIFNKTYFNQLAGYTLNGEKITDTSIEINNK